MSELSAEVVFLSCRTSGPWIAQLVQFIFISTQENKYKEAVGFYEPIVKKHYDNVSTRLSCCHYI